MNENSENSEITAEDTRFIARLDRQIAAMQRLLQMMKSSGFDDTLFPSHGKAIDFSCAESAHTRSDRYH